MQIIKLLNNQSDGNFIITTYPDGQQNVTLALDKLSVKVPVEIHCRIRTFGELEVLLALVSALSKYDFHIKEIYFAYLFGMRSDRAFTEGQCNYWRSVVAPILNNIISFTDGGTVLFPHSAYGVSRIEGLGDTWSSVLDSWVDAEVFDKKLVIAGDKSATRWLDYFGVYHTEDYIWFDKLRSSSTLMTTMSDENLIKIRANLGMPILLVDDLCDGGASFIAAGSYLKKAFPNVSLELFVAHGLFSKGFTELFDLFDKIYTTNSYQDFPQNPDDPFCIDPNKLQVFEVI